MAKLDKDLTFEMGLKQLEQVVRQLEAGQESLESCMELYEKGILLKNFCQQQLRAAEGKWEVLRQNEQSEVSVEPISKSILDTEEASSSTE